jgi:hypothetical protein
MVQSSWRGNMMETCQIAPVFDQIDYRHEIFSPLTVARLCVTIGHQVNEFNSFCWLRDESIYRFEHIETNSSGKVVAKSVDSARVNA